MQISAHGLGGYLHEEHRQLLDPMKTARLFYELYRDLAAQQG